MADNSPDWMSFAQRSRDEGGLGLRPHQAAGLVGNLQNESGPEVTPWGPSGDNGSAWGTAQWRGDRLEALKAHAAENGLDYKTVPAQQAFMRHEFDGSENKSYKALQATTTPEEAATIVNTQYERSADRSGNRERAALKLSGSQPMAYADTQPALSPQVVPGALQNGGQPIAEDKYSWLAQLGQTLKDMSPGIAQDPAHAQVLEAAAAASRPAKVAAGTWSQSIDPKTGVGTMLHSTTGQRLTFQAHAPQETESRYGIVKAADPSKGLPAQYGYPPTREEAAAAAAAANTPEAKAAADATAAAAAERSSLSGQPFLDNIAASNPDKGYAARVKATAEGRADLPTGKAAQAGTPGAQFVQDVMQYDPTYEQGNSKARTALRAQYESSSAPNSPANMIKVSGTAMHHGGLLSDAIENFKSFNDHHDSAVPYGSWALNSIHNSQLAGNTSPEAQAYAAAIKMRENYGDEVAKFYGGGPAGEHAKKRAIENLDFAKSLPELRSIMASDMDMIHGKAATLQDAWRTGMRGSTAVPDFPVISEESQGHVDKIKSRFDQTKEAGSYVGPGEKKTAKPATGAFKDVPWSYKQ